MKICTLVLVGLLPALPVSAGEAYIPFVAADAPPLDSGRSTTPVVDLFNRGVAPRRYAVWFTPAGADGTKVRQSVGLRWLDGGSSAHEACCSRESGVLVVTGAPQVAVGARLGFAFVGPPATDLLTRLPVVTARDGLPRGATGVLMGLRGDPRGANRASLGILNLERSPAVCSVAIGNYDERFPELFEFVVPPLSVAAFPDIFSRLVGVRGPPPFETRTRATCNRLFYPFGINFEGTFQPVDGVFQFNVRWLEFVPPGVPIPNP